MLEIAGQELLQTRMEVGHSILTCKTQAHGRLRLIEHALLGIYLILYASGVQTHTKQSI